MPTNVAASDAVRFAFFEIRPEFALAALNLIFRPRRVEQEQPLLQYRITLFVALHFVCAQVTRTWQNRLECLDRQASSINFFSSQDKVAIAAGRNAAFDFEEVAERRASFRPSWL